MTSRLTSRAGLTALGALVSLVLGSGVVAALALPATPADAVVLRQPVGVTLISQTGLRSRGRSGEHVPLGDVVEVSGLGQATLAMSGRSLLMAGGSQVQLVSPVLTELRTGDVVAISQGSRPWSLLANGVTVSQVHGRVRIDRSYSIRIASYEGSARLDVSTGATLTLGDLSQAVASESGLPASAPPLQLLGDELDKRADPALVAADASYTALADQIDADPYVSVTFGTGLTVKPSERILPVAIGEAASGPGTTAEHESEAETLRAARGSWGVVAARLGAGLPNVQSKLSDILDAAADRTTPTSVAAVASVAQALRVVARAVPTASTPALPVVATPVSSSAAPSPGERRPVTVSPTPAVTIPTVPAVGITPVATPSLSPTPTPTPVPGLVGSLLKAVVGIVLPSASPSATSQSGTSQSGTTRSGSTRSGSGKAGVSTPVATVPVAVSPTPTRTPSVGLVGGLVGGLLGGH